MRTIAAVAIVVATLPTAPAGAAGGTVAYSADRTALVVTTTGAHDLVLLVQEAAHLVVRSPVPLTEDDDGCTASGNDVRCEIAGVDRVYVRLGAGSDRLVTGSGAPALRLIVDAGPGDDRVEGSRGNDDMQGRTGTDTVNYSSMSRPATIVICACGMSGDWDGGERDVVRPGVENAVGTTAGDYLRGDGNANRLTGGPGNDLVYGEGGDDVLPVDGDDWVFGGGGYDVATYEASPAGVTAWLDEKPNDSPGKANVRADVEQVTGSRYADVLLGNGRPNVLRGGPGDDELVGFSGDDLLIGDAGADSYSPGPGFDRCRADQFDVNPRDCEG